MLKKLMGFLTVCLAGMWLMTSCSSLPVTPQLILTVVKPTGGTISSADKKINCGTEGTACQMSVSAYNLSLVGRGKIRTTDTNTLVALTATADSGKVFSGWANDCAASGTAASCEVTVSANKTVSATFNTVGVPQFTLTVTKPTGGKISSSVGGISCGTSADVCTAKFDTGTKVTLTAVADSGKVFSGWGNDCAGKATTCEVTMGADKTVTGSFLDFILRSAVQVMGTDGIAKNYSEFTVVNGKSLTAFYDILDSAGNQIPKATVLSLCSSDGSKVTIEGISDSTFTHRFKVSMKATGNATLNVVAGSDCAASALVSQAVSGVALTKTLSLGYEYSIALLADGTVKAWGNNSFGQLGLGDTKSKSSPTAVPNLSDVLQLSAGSVHNMALLADGTVKVWGDNRFGQLGLGDRTNTSNPTAVPGLENVLQLSAGGSHSMVLLADGTVKAWGDNRFGELGLGDRTNTSNPTAVPGLENVLQLSTGSIHSMALLADGTVKVWGYNAFEQLGLGDAKDQISPTEVPGLSNVLQLSAGSDHSMAVLKGGTVKAWGSNIFGQLGLGSVGSKNTPQTVTGLSNVLQVVAGHFHSMALLADGTVKAWGSNDFGQLGLGNTTDENTPQTVAGLSNVLQLSAGINHSMAVLADGTVKAWGQNSKGELGLGNTTSQNTPQTVTGL